MARRTKAEARETRDAILEAAEQAFCARGVDQTTLGHVAEAAGVTRGAIYWHFQDKEDLLNAMIVRAELPLDDLRTAGARAADGDALGELQRAAERCLQRLAGDTHYQRVCRILLHGCVRMSERHFFLAEEEKVEDEVRSAIRDLFETARRQGTLAPAFTPETATWALVSYMRGMHSHWLLEPEKVDLAAEAPRLLGAFFAGLRAAPGTACPASAT